MNEHPAVGQRLYEAVKRVFGWPAAAVTMLAGLFAPALLGVDQVPYYVALPVAGILILVTAVAIDLAAQERLTARRFTERITELEGAAKLPSVITCKIVMRGSAEVKLLILRYNPLYARGHLVSIYSVEPDQFERPLGYGNVDHVQVNGLMQVEILDWRADASEFLQRITNNDREALDALLVQPSVPSSIATLNQPADPRAVSSDHPEYEGPHERSAS